MRWIVWILMLASAAVGLALLMRVNHGNVAVLWPPYRVDVSVNLALLVLGVLFVAMHLLLVAIGKALDLPERVREYRERRGRDSAVMALRDAVLALFEGRFGRAERLAQMAREDVQLAGPAALIAARAAHRMRETERRDRWLVQAENDRGSMHAELMTTAELALEEQDAARAIASIERLHSKGMRHIHALRVALRAYEQAEDWEHVLQVLRQLEKRDVLHPAAIRGLRVRACRVLLSRRAGDAEGLRAQWNQLRAGERDLPEVLEAAALAFARAGDTAQARRLLEAGLAEEFSPRLLHAYAGLAEVSARERLQQVERWRDEHGDDADITLALGRLCMAESLWGKAADYLGRSLASREDAQVHLALADLAERVGKMGDAALHYRAAARSKDLTAD
ncbi:MAG TPA: heme biosynthesis HemY N-terminal domain-containing protein [Burkholderiaceae bacterium]|nr:heme biosynthesis HemY N-terminal domain-containing protein [Burkholderiaceae bacterium]